MTSTRYLGIKVFRDLPFPVLVLQDVKTFEIIVSEVNLEGLWLLVKSYFCVREINLQVDILHSSHGLGGIVRSRLSLVMVILYAYSR